MAKGSLIEKLDDAVEAAMTKPDKPLPQVDARIEGILRIAGELRDLPRGDFKARLRADLFSGATEAPARAAEKPVGGKPLFTEEDIVARFKEMEEEPPFAVHDIGAAMSDLPEMSMKFLAPVNNATLIVSRGSRPSHWERHTGGDELIYVTAGATDVVTLTERGEVRSSVRAGSMFVCPQGLWHKLIPRPSVAAIYLTPGETTEASDAKDPRPKGERKRPSEARGRSRSTGGPRLQAHDLRAALKEVPHLNITAATTGEEADAAVRQIAKIGKLTFGVMSYSGLTPWERHPEGDELLYALDGEVEVTVLSDEGPVKRTLSAGSAFVCPQGLWHRQLAPSSVSMLYGTPIEHGEFSFADDPRADAGAAEKTAEVGAEPAAEQLRRGIMPFLYVEGAARAVEFYKEVFGAAVLMLEEEPGGVVSHAQLQIGDTRVMLSDPTSRDVRERDTQKLSRTPRSYGGSPVHLYVYVDDADAVVGRAVARGAKIVQTVEDREWGDRCGGIEDPYGHVWWVGTPLAQVRRH
ncbi:MAG TPA: cupin domain-containing protein [Candidatus Acidoferrales bacterium]|nr:cupin domain-containing protein [Candidatus Acidoferrales bacterium]